MTLEEAKIEFIKNPTKRIIREGNGKGMVSVWFTVSTGLLCGCLMCNTLEMDNRGHYINTRRAAFQESTHTDWVLID
jgi:hypothetical protein